MITLAENKYMMLQYNEALSLFIVSYTSETIRMSDEQYKKEMLLLTQQVEKYLPYFVLLDTTELHVILTPAMQDWINNNITTRFIKTAIKKIAIVMSKDIIAELALKQVVDDAIPMKLPYDIQYFDNNNNAIAWFQEK